MSRISSTCCKHFPVFSSFTTYCRVCNQINTTGTTSGAGTAPLPEHYRVHTRFQWGSCYSIFSFICMFCRSLFVILYFFFWPLCCLFFFDIRIMIAPLISSNSSITVIKFVSDLQQVCGLFSPGTPVSSNSNTDRHDITEILLKVA